MFEHPHAVRVGIALGCTMLVGGLIVYIFGNLGVCCVTANILLKTLSRRFPWETIASYPTSPQSH